jgi:hypothetical protein
MKLYEFGEWCGDEEQEDLVIIPGNSRIAWVNYVTLPTGLYFLEYELKEGSYKTKKVSPSLVIIKNNGNEEIILSFCRRFKK